MMQLAELSITIVSESTSNLLGTMLSTFDDDDDWKQCGNFLIRSFVVTFRSNSWHAEVNVTNTESIAIINMHVARGHPLGGIGVKWAR